MGPMAKSLISGAAKKVQTLQTLRILRIGTETRSGVSIAQECRRQARIVSFGLGNTLDLRDHASGDPVHHVGFGCLAAGELADDAPFVKDQDAVADPDGFLDLR